MRHVERRGFDVRTTPLSPYGPCRGAVIEKEEEKQIAEVSASQNQRSVGVRRRWNPIASTGSVRGTPPRCKPKLANLLRHYLPKRTDALFDVEPHAASVLDHATSCPQHRLLETMQVPTAA